MERSRKEQIVSDLHGTLDEAAMVVVTRHNGLTVAEANELRRSVRAAGASFRVVKNRLALRALDGTPYEGLREFLGGPSAFATSRDPLAAARATVDYAGTNDKLVIVGGAMGSTMLDADGIRNLASLPSLDALRARLLGALQGPATRLAGILQAPGGQLARLARARVETDTRG